MSSIIKFLDLMPSGKIFLLICDITMEPVKILFNDKPVQYQWLLRAVEQNENCPPIMFLMSASSEPARHCEFLGVKEEWVHVFINSVTIQGL